jgi:hypothetical protein
VEIAVEWTFVLCVSPAFARASLRGEEAWIPALGLNFSDCPPVGWIDERLTAKGGEFTVRAIGGNRQFDGCVRQLDWRT